MEKPFAELQLKDRYKEALIDMIQAKIEGKEVVASAEEQQPVVDIMTALKESIDKAKAEKKPMKKASGKKKDSETREKKVS
jgi:DNA end-binding protein Ku